MGIRLTTSFRNVLNKLYQIDIHDNQFVGSFDVKYGLLYNWYAATDARLICADGWEVPEQSDWDTLSAYLSGYLVAGGKLKETGTTYWETPNTGATNEVNFNGRGAGFRDYNAGGFYNINIELSLISRTERDGYPDSFYQQTLENSSSVIVLSAGINKAVGESIRLIKTTTTLTHGQTGTYIGNDGKKYRTICIGTQEWLADNLCETKFRNGDYIPGFDAGVYTPITNAAWAALTTAALCAYNNDTDNI